MVIPARKLAGAAVRNHQGESLGVIEDIVLDSATGRVAYAVLAFGGILGMGTKLFAVPWNALTLEEDQVLVDATRQELAASRGFDPDHWPEEA